MDTTSVSNTQCHSANGGDRNVNNSRSSSNSNNNININNNQSKMTNKGVIDVYSYIGGKFVEHITSSDDDDLTTTTTTTTRTTKTEWIEVTDPSTGHVIARVAEATSDEVNHAVSVATIAFETTWRHWTIKARAAVLLKLHGLIRDHAMELANLIVLENGKNRTEALADVAKGNETVEYACSLATLATGRSMRVSGNVICQDDRVPLGVVASIVPFNFPFMVPMWTIPIALVLGNCIVLKPSEKVPLTMRYVTTLFEKAGIPSGVFQMIQGSRGVVQSLMQHPGIQAITFVGSSPVAEHIATTCHDLSKRVLALGGAKNHLVALTDESADTFDVTGAASDIVVSFAGCAGQRCMAASVLLCMEGPCRLALIQAVVDQASQIVAGTGPGQMGPVIDVASYEKIQSYIQAAEADGAQILLDGRTWLSQQERPPPLGGNWIGPTIILHSSPKDKTMRDEVFGPVLSIYICHSWQEAIDIENDNPFGNAASVYTSHGSHADWFTNRFRAAMMGVNIGIPVPREPFSFGGLFGTRSKFGNFVDITADGGVEFFSNRIKITRKWPEPRMVTTAAAQEAEAIFTPDNGDPRQQQQQQLDDSSNKKQRKGSNDTPERASIIATVTTAQQSMVDFATDSANFAGSM